MLFKYKITLDVEVEFDAPLLGTDTTKRRRKQVDSIAKRALQEMINFNVNELVKYPHRFKLELPKKFSIYTRRIFDKYTYEDIRT